MLVCDYLSLSVFSWV